MDLGVTLRTAIPTLDAPVLTTLAGTTQPMSGREVWRLPGGSDRGVRLVLARLARHGLVHVDRRGNAAYYTANRGHLAWDAIEELILLRRRLHSRLRDELETWAFPPAHASLFGSAARGDGGPDSDIDLLLVSDGDVGPVQEDLWDEQVTELAQKVEAWTGNDCQTFDLTPAQLLEHVLAEDRLIDNIVRDSVLLFGRPLQTYLRELDRTVR